MYVVLRVKNSRYEQRACILRVFGMSKQNSMGPNLVTPVLSFRYDFHLQLYFKCVIIAYKTNLPKAQWNQIFNPYLTLTRKKLQLFFFILRLKYN